MGAPPSWPHLTPVISQRPHLWVPTHWGYGFSVCIWGGHKLLCVAGTNMWKQSGESVRTSGFGAQLELTWGKHESLYTMLKWDFVMNVTGSHWRIKPGVTWSDLPFKWSLWHQCAEYIRVRPDWRWRGQLGNDGSGPGGDDEMRLTVGDRCKSNLGYTVSRRSWPQMSSRSWGRSWGWLLDLQLVQIGEWCGGNNETSRGYSEFENIPLHPKWRCYLKISSRSSSLPSQ